MDVPRFSPMNNRDEIKDIRTQGRVARDAVDKNSINPAQSRAAKAAITGKTLEAENKSYSNINKVNTYLRNRYDMTRANIDAKNVGIKNKEKMLDMQSIANKKQMIDSLGADITQTYQKRELEEKLLSKDKTEMQLIIKAISRGGYALSKETLDILAQDFGDEEWFKKAVEDQKKLKTIGAREFKK